MTEIEQVKVCFQCRSEFRERANYGHLRCRMHPSWESTDSLRRLRCCGYRPSDGTAALSREITLEDAAGCLPCDHRADSPITDAPLAILPTLLVDTGFVRAPIDTQIVLRVDGAVLARMLGTGKSAKLRVMLPTPLDSPELDLVTCAFQVLAAFVQSTYYDQTRYPSIRDARQRFENNITAYMASPGWNTEIDQHPEFDAFATNDEQELTPLDDATADVAYAATSRNAMHIPATRLAVVRAMKMRNDVRTLVATAVPFYVIKRVGNTLDSGTLRRIALHTKLEGPRVDPALRDFMYANATERKVY